MSRSVEPALADDARPREGGAMFGLSVVRKLGLVTVVVKYATDLRAVHLRDFAHASRSEHERRTRLQAPSRRSRGMEYGSGRTCSLTASTTMLGDDRSGGAA